MNASSREPPPQDWEARLIRVELAIERIDSTMLTLRADVAQLREQVNALTSEVMVIKATLGALQSSVAASFAAQESAVTASFAAQQSAVAASFAAQQSSVAASFAAVNERLDRADRRMDVIEAQLADIRDVHIMKLYAAVADNSLQIEKLRSQMFAMRAADLRYYTTALAGVTATLLGAMAKGFHWV